MIGYRSFFYYSIFKISKIIEEKGVTNRTLNKQAVLEIYTDVIKLVECHTKYTYTKIYRSKKLKMYYSMHSVFITSDILCWMLNTLNKCFFFWTLGDVFTKTYPIHLNMENVVTDLQRHHFDKRLYKNHRRSDNWKFFLANLWRTTFEIGMKTWNLLNCFHYWMLDGMCQYQTIPTNFPNG